MRQRTALVQIVLLVAALLLLGVPASAADVGHDEASARVEAPSPTPDDDAVPSAPRFASAQRSPLAEASPGPLKTLHAGTAAGLGVGRSRVRASEVALGTVRGDATPPAVYLLVCSFLN